MNEPFRLTVTLGLFFLIIFTADTSFSTIVTQVYQQKDLKSLGPATLASSYTAFMVFSLISPGITSSYKVQMTVASALYTLQFIAGLSLQYIPDTLKYIVVISSAFIIGISSAVLWTSFGGYMHCMFAKYQIFDKEGYYFGLWSAIYSIQSITGSLITTFALGFFSHQIYFAITSILGLISMLFCLFFIKNIQTAEQIRAKQKFNALKASKEVFKFYPKMKHVLGFIFLNGIAIAFTYNSLLRLIPKQQTPEQQNLKAGIAFTFNGIGAMIGGYFGGIIYDYFSLKISTHLNTVLFLITLTVTFVATYIQNFYFSCGIFFLWGITLYYFEIWILISCSRLYQGKLESFSVNKQFHSISFIIFEVLMIVTQNELQIGYILVGMLVFSIPMIIGFYFLTKTRGKQIFLKVKSQAENQFIQQQKNIQ